MNHGQFYKADKLVEAVHKNAGGIFAGFRGAHAFGRIYQGTFTPTAMAETISRAAHFQGPPVPATARLSAVSGDPNQKPENVVAMATKFYLPDGTITDLIGITLPAFFAGTPEEFFGFEEARAADPTTGKLDQAKLLAYLVNHPNAARVVHSLQTQLAPMSLAQTSFRALHAYRFSNAAGESRWARYHWEPEAGVAGQPVEELAKKPHDYLFDEFENRLKGSSVAFTLDLQFAKEGDSLDDPSATWPDDRERMRVGRLEFDPADHPRRTGRSSNDARSDARDRWHRGVAGRPDYRAAARGLHAFSSAAHRRLATAVSDVGSAGMPVPQADLLEFSHT